mgnify:CR=1 FL=1
MELSSFQRKTIQHQFDRFAKQVIAREAKKQKKELARRSSYEKSFSELSQQEQDRLYTEDVYPSDCYCFSVAGYDVIVKNDAIGQALRSAFKQAVRWEVIARNPFDFVTLPKVESKPRDIWTAETIRKALDSCKDAKLYVAMNLAFACSLRVGEILGLTWDNVHIEDEDIAKDNASVYVDKELFRASKEVMDTLGNRDIKFVFPPVMDCPKIRLILKTPKTRTSVRRVWLPKTLAYILREWRDTQRKQKEFLGNEYLDYNLVVAHGNGRPCDSKIIEKSFNRLKEDAGLPNVVFHSLRHSSTTYKLKLNHGDIKATQGDTGHAQADMITRVYAHILDEDRKVNAQKFESAFYANPDLRDVKPPEEQKPAIDLAALIEQLKQSPELAQTLAGLIAK